jgi:transcriptional regulator with XRE-family HTH domain
MALRIKQLRTERGWTQADLASRASISRSQLAMIESETRPANTRRLASIAAALGVSPDELFAIDGQERALLDVVRRLSAEDLETVVRVAEALAAKPLSD